MTEYRRNFVRGGSFFFTVNLLDRRSRLLTENIGALRTAFRKTKADHPFSIEAIVVLPDHLHAIWSLPEGDSDFATRWRPDQVEILTRPAAGRTDFREPPQQGRTRHLAAALLGAHVARRRRFRAPRQLHSFQSR